MLKSYQPIWWVEDGGGGENQIYCIAQVQKKNSDVIFPNLAQVQALSLFES